MAAEATSVAVAASDRKRLGARLRVEQHHVNPWMARVWLNDMELTAPGGGLMGLEISFSGNSVTTATLKLGLDDLEVDTETVLILQAMVARKYAG